MLLLGLDMTEKVVAVLIYVTFLLLFSVSNTVLPNETHKAKVGLQLCSKQGCFAEHLSEVIARPCPGLYR